MVVVGGRVGRRSGGVQLTISGILIAVACRWPVGEQECSSGRYVCNNTGVAKSLNV